MPKALVVEGGFVIFWVSMDQDGDAKGLFGQWFNADGQKVGLEFQVNRHDTAGAQTLVSATTVGSQLVIIWNSLWQDGDDYGVFGMIPCCPGLTQDAIACVACPANTFQSTWVTQGCETCPSGLFASNSSSWCCPAGQTEAPGVEECCRDTDCDGTCYMECPANTYQDGTQCVPCPNCTLSTAGSTSAGSCLMCSTPQTH
eukprot:3941061-Rhodomonas_salina.2